MEDELNHNTEKETLQQIEEKTMLLLCIDNRTITKLDINLSNKTKGVEIFKVG